MIGTSDNDETIIASSEEPTTFNAGFEEIAPY